jgi:hypothetical protein
LIKFPKRKNPCDDLIKSHHAKRPAFPNRLVRARFAAALRAVFINRLESALQSDLRDDLREFLEHHRIHEVECVIPDMTGVA